MYINGQLTERLEGAKISFKETKDKIAKVQTLVFPLGMIGDTANSFKGEIDNIKVLNEEKR